MSQRIHSITKNFDHDEPISRMEPLLIGSGSRFRTELSELVFELTRQSTGLSCSLPKCIKSSIIDLTRNMNSYYSNLIEGNDTHPIDIERVLNKQIEGDAQRVRLQIEAKAHVKVQKWIDEVGLSAHPTTISSLCEIHRNFFEEMPEISNAGSVLDDQNDQLIVVPGEFRTQTVEVGRHVPINPNSVLRFMQRFESVYQQLGKQESVLNAGASHHRMLWIHPFGDGNGRVARLMSHAILSQSLETESLWSITRGLALNESQYKALLANCDLPRRNDLDGRGNLSEEALHEFCRFFLQTCIDQVGFMEHLLNPRRLRDRIMTWAYEEIKAARLPLNSNLVLNRLLLDDDLRRSEVSAIMGTGERQSRRVTSALEKRGVIVANHARAPFRLNVPADVASSWLPGLFPDK